MGFLHLLSSIQLLGMFESQENVCKNVQIFAKLFERGVNVCVEGYLNSVFVKNCIDENCFYVRACCCRSLRKSEMPHKIKLCICTLPPFDVLGTSCTFVAGIHVFTCVVKRNYLINCFNITDINNRSSTSIHATMLFVLYTHGPN